MDLTLLSYFLIIFFFNNIKYTDFIIIIIILLCLLQSLLVIVIPTYFFPHFMNKILGHVLVFLLPAVFSFYIQPSYIHTYSILSINNIYLQIYKIMPLVHHDSWSILSQVEQLPGLTHKCLQKFVGKWRFCGCNFVCWRKNTEGSQSCSQCL